MTTSYHLLPHSTLIYLYVSSDPEPDIPDTWGWCINIGQDQGGMNDWCLYCTYTYGMNVFIILVNAVYSTEWWVTLGETNFFWLWLQKHILQTNICILACEIADSSSNKLSHSDQRRTIGDTGPFWTPALDPSLVVLIWNRAHSLMRIHKKLKC